MIYELSTKHSEHHFTYFNGKTWRDDHRLGHYFCSFIYSTFEKKFLLYCVQKLNYKDRIVAPDFNIYKFNPSCVSIYYIHAYDDIELMEILYTIRNQIQEEIQTQNLTEIQTENPTEFLTEIQGEFKRNFLWNL